MSSSNKSQTGSATSGLQVTTSPYLSDGWSPPPSHQPMFQGPAADLAAAIHAALIATAPPSEAAAKRASQGQTPSLGKTVSMTSVAAPGKYTTTIRKVTPPTPTPAPSALRETPAARVAGAQPTAAGVVHGPPHTLLTSASIGGDAVPANERRYPSPSAGGSDNVFLTGPSSLASMSPSTPSSFASQPRGIPLGVELTPLGYWEYLDVAAHCVGDDILNPIWLCLFQEAAAIHRTFDPWRCHELRKSTKYIFPDPRVTTTPLGFGSAMLVAPTIFGSMAEVTAGLASFIRVKHRLACDVYVPPEIEQVLHFVAYPPPEPPLPPGEPPSLVTRPPPQPIPSTRQSLIRRVVLKGYHYYGHSSVNIEPHLAVRCAVKQEVGAYAGPLASLQGQIVPRMYGAWAGDKGACYPRDCYCWYLMFEFLHPWHKGMQATYGPTFRHLPRPDKARVYNLYKKLHSAGVAHNNLDMRHILQGEDGRLLLISFEKSYYDVPGSSPGHKQRLRQALVNEKQLLLVELGWYNPDGSRTPDCPAVSWPVVGDPESATSEESLSTGRASST